MQQLTPKKHPVHILIILTLFGLVGLVSIGTFIPTQSFLGQGKAVFLSRSWLFMLGFSVAMLIKNLISNRSALQNKLFAGYAAVLTDFRYLRFAIATGAAFSGAFAFIAGGSHVFIDQLNLSFTTYGYLFAITVGCYLLSATVGTSLTNNMSRSQSSMLAASLMLMGAVTCMGSSFLTNGTSIPGYLIGMAIYKLGMGFFMPLCQARAVEHMTDNAGIAAGLIFFIEILMATLVTALVHLLPEAGTLTLSAITLVAIIITNLCLLGVDREVDIATPQAT